MKNATQVYYGRGKGKTSAALGLCIREAGLGKSVMIVQFLKGKDWAELEFIKRLEPEVKLFRFEKARRLYSELSEEEKEEEKINILNGLNYVRKVLTTGQCDVLLADEFLGLIEEGIITAEEACELIREKNEDMELILTGLTMPEELLSVTDEVYRLEVVKES